MPDKKLTIGDILVTSRPFWWFMTVVPFVAGWLAGDWHLSWPLIIGALYFSLPYNLFIYGINDIFDYESDVRNPRKSGLEGAVLQPSTHKLLGRWIVLLNVPFLFYLTLVGDRFSGACLFAIVFAGLAYSVKFLRFKEIPLLDSLTSAVHYTAPFLLGLLLAGSNRLLPGVLVAFYVWAVANHAFKAIQDIKPDREGGIHSIATYLGVTNTVVFCLFAYMVAAALPALLFGTYGIIPTALLAAYPALTMLALLSRPNNDNPIFHRLWQVFTYLNYVLGTLLVAYLFLLQQKMLPF